MSDSNTTHVLLGVIRYCLKHGSVESTDVRKKSKLYILHRLMKEKNGVMAAGESSLKQINGLTEAGKILSHDLLFFSFIVVLKVFWK